MKLPLPGSVCCLIHLFLLFASSCCPALYPHIAPQFTLPFTHQHATAIRVTLLFNIAGGGLLSAALLFHGYHISSMRRFSHFPKVTSFLTLAFAMYNCSSPSSMVFTACLTLIQAIRALPFCKAMDIEEW